MIYCKTESSFNGEVTELECGYGADFSCDDCICTGGRMSPQTLKVFRGNRVKYIERAITDAQQLKPETLEINIKDLFKL